MDAELAVKNCRIVNSSLTYDGVIYISGGKIIGISKSLEGNPGELLDASREDGARKKRKEWRGRANPG